MLRQIQYVQIKDILQTIRHSFVRHSNCQKTFKSEVEKERKHFFKSRGICMVKATFFVKLNTVYDILLYSNSKIIVLKTLYTQHKVQVTVNLIDLVIN